MKNYFKTDSTRVNLFMTENADWQKTLSEQSNQLPLLEKMLEEVAMESAAPEDYETIVDNHFRQQLVKQKEDILLLNNELDVQQQRLQNDSKLNAVYDTQALCFQDILRDRIKNVEKNYVDLKCNFMKYLSTVLL
jgi:endo-1,4-beta-D-glucanase Y